ncbi:hypothetical protein [Streptomyces sp. NPDC055013]
MRTRRWARRSIPVSPPAAALDRAQPAPFMTALERFAAQIAQHP